MIARLASLHKIFKQGLGV